MLQHTKYGTPPASNRLVFGTLRNVFIGLALLFVTYGTVVADTMTIYPTDDSWINDHAPNSNYGSGTGFYLGDQNMNEPPHTCRSYLKFDLDPLPPNMEINSAELHLYLKAEGPSPDIVVGAHDLPNDGWWESTITWNNAPTSFSASGSDPHVPAFHWDSWNVTSDVQVVYAGDGIYSVVMKEPTEATDHNWVLFSSKEDDPDLHPYLLIDYGEGEPEPDQFVFWQDLTGVRESDAAWGDMDGDGDLDLALTGETSSGSMACQIYENRTDSLSLQQNLAGYGVENMGSGNLAWGDYDNDGDLDLIVAGMTQTPGVRQTLLLKNDGTGSLSNSFEELTGVSDASVAWGDMDNDGDLDLLVMGHDGTSLTTILYRNYSQGLLEADETVSLIGLRAGSADWADWDGDGDLDLLTTGHDGTQARTIFYLNDPVGTLTNDGDHGLDGIWSSDAAWGDCDNDGDLDLAFTGELAYGGPRCSRIYKNVGAGAMAMDVDVASLYRSSCAWGDYDNDGDLDVAFCGYNGASWYTRIEENTGAGWVNQSFGILGLGDGSVSWADVEGDGDLDFLVTGRRLSNDIYARLYRKEGGVTNTAPSAPTSIVGRYTPTSGGLELSWNGASDLETPVPGLYYCLTIGTAWGANDVYSDTYGTPLMGNTGQNTNLLLDVPPGTYYWSVRTIDSGFAASPWSMGRTCSPDSMISRIIHPIDDAYVDSTTPNTACGTLVPQHLCTGDFPLGGGGISRSYLKFELADVSDVEIFYARMHALALSTDTRPYHVDTWRELNDSWSENTITWNNAPTNFAPTATARERLSGNRHCFWRVTADVTTEASGDGILTEVLRNGTPAEGTPSFGAEYWSDEPPGGTPPSDRPYLEVWYIPQVSGIPDPPIDVTLELLPCSPNPFKDETVIRFFLAQEADISLRIYDVLGRQVRELMAEPCPAADQSVVWDGRDDTGRAVTNGTYYIRLSDGEVRLTRKTIRLE